MIKISLGIIKVIEWLYLYVKYANLVSLIDLKEESLKIKDLRGLIEEYFNRPFDFSLGIYFF